MIFRKLAAPICFFVFVSFASNATCEKLRRLEELTDIRELRQLKYFFAPEKISAVYPGGVSEKGKTFIQGIGFLPRLVEEDGETFLNKYELYSKFIPLTGKAGPIYLRATYIDSITPVVMPSPDELKQVCVASPIDTIFHQLPENCSVNGGLYSVGGKCRTQPDKSRICVVDDNWFPKSAITPGPQHEGTPSPFVVLEEPMVVRELVNKIRVQQDSHE